MRPVRRSGIISTQPYATLVPNCFCRTPHHCRASSWRKIAYSITQSLNHSPSLFDEPKLSLCNYSHRPHAAVSVINLIPIQVTQLCETFTRNISTRHTYNDVHLLQRPQLGAKRTLKSCWQYLRVSNYTHTQHQSD